MKLIIHERVTLDGLTHLPGEVEVDEARAVKLLATFKGGEVSVASASIPPAPAPELASAPVVEAEPEPEAPVAEEESRPRARISGPSTSLRTGKGKSK